MGKTRMMNYDYRRATDDIQEEAFNELEVADYLVFMFALDVYARHLKETGQGPDNIFSKGLSLLRRMDQDHLDRMNGVLQAGIKNPGSLHMLAAALALPVTAKGISLRALRLRTVLTRGGVGTAKHIFGTSLRARKAVTDAISAATSDDAMLALSQFASISLKNKRLEGWISAAADRTMEAMGEQLLSPQNPVHEASKQVGEDSDVLTNEKIAQDATSPSTPEHGASNANQAAILTKVEANATAAASKAIEAAKLPDEPPKKSEVIGIATAVATAVANDPKDLKNIPPAFVDKGISLDPEQMDAALTNGRVLVAAGAGSGKSTTSVSRVAYLVDNQNVNPSRVMMVSFNRKAANELQEKLQKKLGNERGQAVMCDTMHTVFRKFIIGDPKRGIPAFGTPEEQRMMTTDLIAPAAKGRASTRVKPGDVSRTINTLWNQCKPEQLAAYTGWPLSTFKEGAPKSKKAALYINKWAGNGVSLEQAKAGARSNKERLAALYYEFYLGLKGDIPGWRPQCGQKAYETFMGKFRRGGERLGDMDDMLKLFKDILERDPKAKATIQGMYDHFIVDEAQDCNSVQSTIFDLLSEQVEPDDKKKSIWMVGDPSQAIYGFRGARPELFTERHGKPGWKTKTIRTNYRCAPEIVETANRLLGERPIPMDAVPSPYKARGVASVKLTTEPDNAVAAISTMHDIRRDFDEDSKNRPEDYAVLSRTNAELNNFETACIINEIPYTRRGGHGFLDAPESKAVIGYIDLASGTSNEKKQKSLVDALMKPDRGLFLGPDKVEAAVRDAVDDVARSERKDVKDVDPGVLLTDRMYARKLAEYLKGTYRNQLTAKGPWLWNKVVGQLQDQILDMGQDVQDVRKMTQDPEAKTSDLLGFVLDNVKGTVTSWDPTLRREVTSTQSLRENISAYLKLSDDDDDDEVTEDEDKPELDAEGRPVVKNVEHPAKGLGAVQFLYALSEPNKNDHELGILPDKASGFTKKIERYSKLADGLRVDLRKWEDEQAKITDPALRQEKPPAVTLSTGHSTKGLEWPHVTVLMPKGIFPIEIKVKPGEEPPSDEEVQEHEVSERNLAYVSLTRAARTLNVVSIPDPKTGGVSPYIADTGLKEGENVPKPEAPTVVTASDGGHTEALFEISQWPDIGSSTYDRRPA
jgi:superfamily I DNA/RNA helicase